ncbi:MAG: hypothetical protein U1E17_02955 [Geminicoccaceae bacterium]
MDGVGATLIEQLSEFFAEAHNVAAVDALAAELSIDRAPAAVAASSSPLAGKTVVFTGTLERMTRHEAKVRAEALGEGGGLGLAARTMSAGTGRLEAQEGHRAGVQVLSEEEWPLSQAHDHPHRHCQRRLRLRRHRHHRAGPARHAVPRGRPALARHEPWARCWNGSSASTRACAPSSTAASA